MQERFIGKMRKEKKEVRKGMRKQKWLAGLLAFVMSFSMMLPLVSASRLPEDVVGTKYEEAVSLLQALEIMVGDKETGDFRLEDGIIRSEVAKIATGLAGLLEIANSSTGKTKYPDVVENHWANGYINVATSQSYVIGDDVGTFRPDDKITFAEAVAIMVRVLGYEPSAADNGGFPTGYQVVAAQIGLLNGGISKGPDDEATRGIVAQLAFNALTINLMEKTGFGSDVQYEVVDKTLLEDKLGVTKAYGQVVANRETSLEGTSTLKNDEISIKSGETTEIFKLKDINDKEFLAQQVIYYYTEDNNEKTVILLTSDKTKNDVVTVSHDNIDGISGEGKKTFTYWLDKENDSKTQKITIGENVITFYNGVAKEYDLNKIADLKTGHVKFLDSDRDGIFDYAFVTEYRNIVVDEVSATTYRISDKYNQLSLVLDPDDKDMHFTIILDGEEIALSELKEWDILSVAMDGATQAESTVADVIVTRDTVVGKVTEIEDGKRKIGDKFYEIAANYTDAGMPEIALDDEGTFFLDADGKIAAVDVIATAGSNYAYLVKTNVQEGLTDTLQLELFTMEGESVIMNGASKVKVNRESGLTPQEAEAAIKEANGGTAAQLITYDTNAKGEISYVNTATENSSGSAMTDAFTKDYASESGNLTYSSSAKKLGRFNVNADTVVFDIPKDSDDSEDYAIRKMDMFVDKTAYEVDVFDLSEDMTAKVIVVKDSKLETNAESSIAVVQRISSAQNSDRVTVDKLYALQDGEVVELLAKDTDTLVKGEGTKLQAGDIIQYRTNAKNEIEKVTVLFDSADRNNEEAEILKDYEGTEMTTVLGRVTKKFASSINVVSEGLPETNFDISNAKIYLYDYSKSSSMQVRTADASEIIKYDEADPYKVFLRIFKGEVAEVVIIKAQ